MRRILIDECINPGLAPLLRSALPECSVDTVGNLGWTGYKDHVLIPAMSGRVDVFVTIDKGFEFEHNLKKLSFGIIVLTAANNQMPSYERLLEQLIRQIGTVGSGQVVHVADPAC